MLAVSPKLAKGRPRIGAGAGEKLKPNFLGKNPVLIESRRFPHHDGIGSERIRRVLEVLNVEEVGEFGIGII